MKQRRNSHCQAFSMNACMGSCKTITSLLIFVHAACPCDSDAQRNADLQATHAGANSSGGHIPSCARWQTSRGGLEMQGAGCDEWYVRLARHLPEKSLLHGCVVLFSGESFNSSDTASASAFNLHCPLPDLLPVLLLFFCFSASGSLSSGSILPSLSPRYGRISAARQQSFYQNAAFRSKEAVARGKHGAQAHISARAHVQERAWSIASCTGYVRVCVICDSPASHPSQSCSSGSSR